MGVQLQVGPLLQQGDNESETVARAVDRVVADQAGPGLLDVLDAQQVEGDVVDLGQAQQATEGLVAFGVRIQPGGQAVGVLQLVLMQVVAQGAQVEHAQRHPGAGEDVLVALAGFVEQTQVALLGGDIAQHPHVAILTVIGTQSAAAGGEAARFPVQVELQQLRSAQMLLPGVAEQVVQLRDQLRQLAAPDLSGREAEEFGGWAVGITQATAEIADQQPFLDGAEHAVELPPGRHRPAQQQRQAQHAQQQGWHLDEQRGRQGRQ